jgi:hypothetical protein
MANLLQRENKEYSIRFATKENNGRGRQPNKDLRQFHRSPLRPFRNPAWPGLVCPIQRLNTRWSGGPPSGRENLGLPEKRSKEPGLDPAALPASHDVRVWTESLGVSGLE